MIIEFEEMKIWKEGIESTIIIDIYSFKRINVNSCVLEDLSMILTCYFIDYIFLIDAGCQERMIDNEKISDAFLIHY